MVQNNMALIDKAIPDFKLTQFTRGLGLPFRGVAYLFAHRGLKRYAALPLLLNVILYGVALLVFFHFLWNWQVSEVTWEFWGPIGRWFASAVNWMGGLVKVVVAMVAVAAAFFTFTAVGMVLASPLNDILSEKVEVVYCGSDNKLSMPFRFTTKAALLSVYDSLCNLGRQLLFTLMSLPFLLVPLVGFLPLFLVGAYFAGFGFLDASLARNFLRPPHKKLIVDKHFWEILGFGVAMQALFAIPFLGMLLMPVGVVAGTLIYCGEDWEKLLAGAGMPQPEGFIPPKCLPEETATASVPASPVANGSLFPEKPKT